MLQQTQVSRVLPKYEEFLKKFPSLRELHKASTADILKAWKGMGYNRRALYLKKISSIPTNEKELLQLPGIGRYTARAILVFAYKKDIAMVDTNIRKIIAHFFFDDKPQKDSVIQGVADQLVPKGKSWEWHQALMDYGALGMSKAKSHKAKIIPFKNSNRYFRGKLMDILRETSVKEKILLKNFSQSIIDGLIKDGLVERKKGVLSLPI